MSIMNCPGCGTQYDTDFEDECPHCEKRAVECPECGGQALEWDESKIVIQTPLGCGPEEVLIFGKQIECTDEICAFNNFKEE